MWTAFRPVWKYIVVLLAGVGPALAVALVSGGVASAHGSMLTSEPSPLTTVDTAPPQVSVYFSGALLPEGSSLVVTGPDGQPIDAGDTRVDEATMVVSLRGARPAGTYTVFWTINAADGHQDAGAYEFSAARATGVGPAGSRRWLGLLLTIGLVAGLAAAALFLWRSVTRASQPKPAPTRATRTTARKRR